MTKTEQPKRSRWQAHKPLLATAFAVAGVFNMMGAVLAAGTPADTPITNTATATYNDGNGTPINAVSNTVTINVAEVAGLNVTAGPVDDVNGGSLVGSDVVTYDYIVTNTGNASTFVFIPGPDGVGVDNGTVDSVDIIDASGNVLGNIPAGGLSTDGLGTVPNGGLIPPDESFTVRVTVTADTLANPTGEFVRVQFGDTSNNNAPPADGSQNQQNIPDDSDSVSGSNDVRTENEGALTPVNGEREAANASELGYNQASVNLAQALLLKTSTYSDATTTDNPADDTIVYNLELNVGSQNFPGVNAGALEGAAINLDGTPGVERVLVSDAIPANTDFDPSVTPTAPANWTVVYSQSPLTTNAQDAAWETTQPAAASITRVGFIYDSASAGGAIQPGTNLTGFSFGVITNGLTAPGGSIANVAQVFGETAGDPNNNVVYDESGDQEFNNLNFGDTPTNNTTTFDPTTDFGVGNANDPENTNNGNDGTGPDGESNVVVITTLPPVVGSLFNGPDNVPTATGPTNTNDDFTNAVATIPAADVSIQGAPSNPDAVTITNQVNNPNATRLDTVTLLPLAPSVASTASGGAGIFGADGDLPDGTLVTISFGGQTAQYEYTLANGFRTQGSATAVPTPVIIGTLQPAGQAGSDQDYTVTIDLPAGTPQIQGFSVPVIAFVDNNGNGTYEDASERATSNITIDRVYTGFMNLLKEARVVFAERDGVTLTPTAFSDDPAVLATFDLRPNDVIEYRISYDNISEATPASGGGNVVLNANNFVITEDGSANGNTWGAVTTHVTATSADNGTISYTVDGTPTATEPTDGTPDVDVYTNTVGTVTPEAPVGTLEFRRQVD